MIARRCRLSFLNAQAALDALPRVVEIMAEELHWSPARAKEETAKATAFLGSMGLPPNATPRRISSEPRTVVECFEGVLGVKRAGERRRRAAQEMIYSRAQFAAGERDEVPFAIILGGDELKEGLVTVKEQKWQFVDGKKVKVESNDKGTKVKRAELIQWIKDTLTFKEWSSGKLIA